MFLLDLRSGLPQSLCRNFLGKEVFKVRSGIVYSVVSQQKERRAGCVLPSLARCDSYREGGRGLRWVVPVSNRIWEPPF